MKLKCTVMLLSLIMIFNGCSKKADDEKKVIISTNYGDIHIAFFPEKSPVSVENFLSYVETDFYDQTIFHRIVPDFVIQAGGHDLEGNPKQTRQPIKNEAVNRLKNIRGSVAYGRTSAPHTATSHFYINLKDNPNLDYVEGENFGYAVFGKVVQGMDVVDQIASVERGHGTDTPVEPVIIESAEIMRVEKEK